MVQRLESWLAQVAYLDEAEAAELLYALFHEWFEDSSQARYLPATASVTQVVLQPDGPRRLQTAWDFPEPAEAGPPGEPAVEHQAMGWLLVEILLRRPFSPIERAEFKPAQVLKLIDTRWEHDFGRPVKPELAEFVSRHLLSGEQAELDSLEMELRLLAQHCAKALPEIQVGWLIESLVGLLNIVPLQSLMRGIARLVFIREEGRRFIKYLDEQRLSRRLILYARSFLYVALLVLAANLPACMRQVDQYVRHSWFLWRSEPALPDTVGIVLLDGWDGTAFDRERLVRALDALLTYQPRAVAVDVYLQAEYPQIDEELKRILSAHPEVIVMGKHSPFDLRPPPQAVTGIKYSPARDLEGRVASDLIRFPTPWWEYGGYDDYLLTYRQGTGERASLAYLLARRGGFAVDPPHREVVNYLMKYGRLRKQEALVQSDWLYRADDTSAEAALAQDTAREALAGKLVLLGVDTADQDRHTSPFDQLRPPEKGIPGVVLHYFALCTMLEPRLRLIRCDSWAWPACALLFFVIIFLSRLCRWFHPLLPWTVLLVHYFVSLAAFLWLRVYLPWLPILALFLLTYPVLCLVVAADHSRHVRMLCNVRS